MHILIQPFPTLYSSYLHFYHPITNRSIYLTSKQYYLIFFSYYNISNFNLKYDLNYIALQRLNYSLFTFTIINLCQSIFLPKPTVINLSFLNLYSL